MNKDPDILENRVNTLNVQRSLHAHKAHDFLCQEALKKKQQGFSIHEISIIMTLPEVRVKNLIDEAENKLIMSAEDKEKRTERMLELEREKRKYYGKN